MNPYRRFSPHWLRYWIRDFLPECWMGLQNLARWAPVVWGTNHFDWDSLASVMEFQLRLMVGSAEHWGTVQAEDSRREMLVCATLLKRIREDKYAFKVMPFVGDYRKCGNWKYFHHADSVAKQDLELLFNIMRRKLRSWWD